jgi:CysZ protein
MLRVMDSYARAHRVLWKHGQWRYLLVPLVMVPLLFLVFTGLVYLLLWTDLFVWLESSWLGGRDVPAELEILLLFAVGVALLGPCYVAFRSIIMVCYIPFMDRLISKTMELEACPHREGDVGVPRAIWRAVLMALCTVTASLAVMVGSVVIGMVPAIGPMLSFAVAFPLQLFLCGASSVDPYLERCGHSVAQSLRIMWKRKAQMVGFGFIGTLGMLIPLVGWFMTPTYSVIAGVVLGNQFDEEAGGPHAQEPPSKF